MSESTAIQTFERLLQEFTKRLESCPPEAWAAPSPCAEWTARDVANHVIGAQTSALKAMGVGHEAAAAASDDVVATWKSVADSLRDALANPELRTKEARPPFRGTLETMVVGVLCSDLVTHTWDFSRATGQDERLEPDAVRTAHAWLQTLGDGIRRPGAFADAIEPPPGADEQTAFLAYTGRRV